MERDTHASTPVTADTVRVATCDNCAETGEIVYEDPDTEAWFCRRCQEDDEAAIARAALALEFAAGGPGWTSYDHVARIAITAYQVGLGEAAKRRDGEQSDGEACDG